MITGATGYIGTYLTSIAVKYGHHVVIASREKPLLPYQVSWVFFDLLSNHSMTLSTDIEIVIHMAVNTNRSQQLDEDMEVFAAQRLIQSTQAVGAKFIFISSQTARGDSPTSYGRVKWRIEQDVLSSGGWVVRPGQVYGGHKGGLFGLLTTLVRKFPIIPVFLPAPNIQPIHVVDLVIGLLRLIECGSIPSGILCLASSQPIAFHHFLSAIASERIRRKRWFIPIPVLMINGVYQLLGHTLRQRFRFDQFNSLFNLPLMETAYDLTQLNLALRKFPSGMHRSGSHQRRQLLQEGRALMTYVLKRMPENALLRRYVRAIEELTDGLSLNLPSWGLRWPILIAILDDPRVKSTSNGRSFAWRLDAATILAEATPEGARRFINYYPKTRLLRSFFILSMTLLVEIHWRILRGIYTTFFRSKYENDRKNNYA